MEKQISKNKSTQKLEQAFISLLLEKPLNKISVSELCTHANINRSGFYANYRDIYDLADHIIENLNQELRDVYAPIPYVHHDDSYLHLLEHIYAHQTLYKACFRLGYERKYPFSLNDRELADQRYHNRHIAYHKAFFNAGLNALIQMWLEKGCKESPQEMADIIKEEYQVIEK